MTLHHWTLPTWLHDPLATRDALAGRDPNAALPELAVGAVAALSLRKNPRRPLGAELRALLEGV